MPVSLQFFDDLALSKKTQDILKSRGIKTVEALLKRSKQHVEMAIIGSLGYSRSGDLYRQVVHEVNTQVEAHRLEFATWNALERTVGDTKVLADLDLSWANGVGPPLPVSARDRLAKMCGPGNWTLRGLCTLEEEKIRQALNGNSTMFYLVTLSVEGAGMKLGQFAPAR